MSGPAGAGEHEALAAARAQGIHRIAVPTPFAVGDVNAYLIEDDPLTLVDAGPNYATALSALEAGVAAAGHSLEEIGLVFITHPHMDHLGLAAYVARRSGARVAALDAGAHAISDFAQATGADTRFALKLIQRHGVDPEVVRALRGPAFSQLSWGDDVPVDQELAVGESLELAGRSLVVAHRPGHSAADALLTDEARRTSIVGDHLLADISSNPLARPAPSGRGRDRPLVAYINSLRKTRAMDLELLLPGHGDPVTDHRELIDQRLSAHERRVEKLASLLADGPRTAHEMARELWGETAISQAYLTTSEVLGHMDLLLDDGRVLEIEADGIVKFEST